MGSVFIIGPPEQAAIADALARARERYIPLDTMLRIGEQTRQDGAVLRIEDRTPEAATYAETARATNVVLPMGYRLAITAEEQPDGMCAHLSLSHDTVPGSVPRPQALQMCAEACGLEGPPVHAWLEEYLIDGQPGGIAINGIWLLTPVGHA